MNKVMLKCLQGYGTNDSSPHSTKELANKTNKIYWGIRNNHEQDLYCKVTQRSGENRKTTKGQVGNWFWFISFIAIQKEMTDLLTRHPDAPAFREL